MEFKEYGKRNVARDTLYFNAYTEDLFVWDNDLENDDVRYLILNKNSNFFNGLADLALDEAIAGYLSRYRDHRSEPVVPPGGWRTRDRTVLGNRASPDTPHFAITKCGGRMRFMGWLAIRSFRHGSNTKGVRAALLR
jgi:hypothetical protein